MNFTGTTRTNLQLMATKDVCSSSRVLELEPHHLMEFSIIFKTLIFVLGVGDLERRIFNPTDRSNSSL